MTAISPSTVRLRSPNSRGPKSASSAADHGDDEQPDDETLREDGRDELAHGDLPDLAHAATAPPAVRVSGSVPGSRGDDPHEHVLERRPLELDTRDGATRQRRSASRARRRRHHEAPPRSRRPARVQRLDLRQRAHDAHVGAWLERLERQRTCIVRPQDRAHGVVEHLAAAMDHDDVVAELLGLRHHVRREQHRRAAPMLREDQILQQPCADGIEAAERLVEDQEIGLVDRSPRGSGSSATCPSRAPRSASPRRP